MKSIFLSYSYNQLNYEFIQILTKEIEGFSFKINNDLSLKNEGAFTNAFDVIKKADMLIALIVDNNPNVYIELGYAIGLGKEVLVFCQPEVELPFSLGNINFIRSDFNSNAIYKIIGFIDRLKSSNENALIKSSNTNFQDAVDGNPGLMHFEFMNGVQFENLVYEWFRRNKFQVKQMSLDLDCGYDLILTNYKEYKKTIVQIKHYNLNSRVSVSQVRQLLGDMHYAKADHAIIITSSFYTNSAIDFSTRCNSKIELWDLNNLREYGFDLKTL